MRLSGSTVTAMVTGAVVGGALVFPATIVVDWRNETATTLQVTVEGERPVALAPGAAATYTMRRWGLTRYAATGAGVRGGGVIGPKDFLLYHRYTHHLTAGGAGR